uniref:Uncharacterized protein n=1 Tax=Tetranychus urticae TaxID=32264 RepID=T1K025_TETUR
MGSRSYIVAFDFDLIPSFRTCSSNFITFCPLMYMEEACLYEPLTIPSKTLLILD